MERQSEHSFLVEYLKYTSGQESPELFHIWVALVLIAAALNRNVHLNRGYYTLYPNVYVILVAGTSKCHKSAAISIGERLLDKMEDPPKTFAQKLTNERFIQFLGEGLEMEEDFIECGTQIKFKSSGLILADELSSFLGKHAMDTGIITTLTALYTCRDEWSYETKQSGRDYLYNIYINMLGASTGKWLRSAIPEEAVGGGFVSRCLFVYQDEPKRLIANPEDEIPEGHLEMEKRLVHDLEAISQIQGEFQMTPEAKRWYEDWYKRDAKTFKNEAETDFFSRWPQFLLKIAMLLSVARSNKLKITPFDLQQANAQLEAIKKCMGPVIDTITTSEQQMPMQKIVKMLANRDEATHEELARYTSRFLRSDDLKHVMQTLQEAGIVDVEIMDNARVYRYSGDHNGKIPPNKLKNMMPSLRKMIDD